jgi:4-aminobutyrate aminotransferase/(S)-3-amino-2-methylpropionate transaminase
MAADQPKFGEQLPRMLVEPPGPESIALANRLAKVEIPAASAISRGEIPVFWDHAQGSNIVDVDGNQYIDITGAMFVTAAGHGNPQIAAAIANQSNKLMHSAGCINPNVPRVKLAETLATITPGNLSASYIGNSGGEAVDMALKTARLYTGKNTIVAFQGGFHGKTMASLAVTSKNFFRSPWQAMLTGTVHSPYGYCFRCAYDLHYPECSLLCARYLDHILGNPSSGVADVAAVIVEPVQGLGGVVVPPAEFLGIVAETCQRRGVLLIVDEIITGFGRTGCMFAVERSQVVPDIMVMGKGMASGFPVSAMITTQEIAACWEAEQHTSTFLGHPVGCAAALAGIQEILDHDLVRRSAELGAYMHGRLQEMQARHSLVGEVRGIGLLAAIELVKDRKTRSPATYEAGKLVNEALKRGVMATLRGGDYNNCMRLAPSFTITREQLDYALDALDESLAVIEAS